MYRIEYLYCVCLPYVKVKVRELGRKSEWRDGMGESDRIAATE